MASMQCRLYMLLSYLAPVRLLRVRACGCVLGRRLGAQRCLCGAGWWHRWPRVSVGWSSTITHSLQAHTQANATRIAACAIWTVYTRMHTHTHTHTHTGLYTRAMLHALPRKCVGMHEKTKYAHLCVCNRRRLGVTSTLAFRRPSLTWCSLEARHETHRVFV